MDENDFDMFADMEQEYNENMLDLEDEIDQEDYIDGVDDDFFATQRNNSQEEEERQKEPQSEPATTFTIPDVTTDDIKSKITDEQMQQNQPEQQQTPATAPSQPVQPTQTEKLEQQVSEHSEQPQPVQPTPVQPTQPPVQPVQPTKPPVQPAQQPPVNPRRTAMEQQQQKVTQEAPFSVVDTKQSALQQPDNSCVIASQGGYQQGQTYETQQQAMYNTTSPSVPQEQAVSQTVQKNNEQKTEEPKLSSEEMQKVKLFCKKIAVFFIALMIIVGIPIMLFKAKNNNPKPKDSIPGETTVETNPDDLLNDDWYDPFSHNEPTTTAITETTAEIQTEAPTEVQTEAPAEASSGRFDTLDELTVYIESNQGLILSGMQMAEIQLQNEEITHEEYIKQINTYITAANELNNLILANASVYTAEGQQDKYNSLVQSMNSVIVYGANAITK